MDNSFDVPAMGRPASGARRLAFHFLFLLAIYMPLPIQAMAGMESSGEFISPDEIVPGMKGYGLTVFQGTEPESFVVEAVGVMKNGMPKQDLVIIFMDDPKLIESNVTAGMSGSPIYFNGRLLGALAYGPIFSKKPIAYVTPIQNMLRELDRPQEPARSWQRVSRMAEMMEPGHFRAEARPSAGAVVPVTSTLAVSGFSAARFKLLEKWFAPYGLIPVAAGGSDPNSSDGPSAFLPGSAIGVQLMSGDMGLTAIGTVTHVDHGGRVLAFGHPFFNIGQTAMPATTARVHTFMPSTYISYKLASPIRMMGSMVQDRQPAIVIDPNQTSPTVPVTVRVENTQTGRQETYRYRVIREDGLTPFLAFVGLSEALDVAEAGPMSTDRAFDIHSRIRLGGRSNPVDLRDVSPSPYKTLFDLLMLTSNGVAEAIPTEFEFDVKVTNRSRIAWITGAKSAGRRYLPGDRVPITVRFRNQDGEESDLDAGFTLPGVVQGRIADLEIRGGYGFSQQEAQPATLNQVVSLMEKRPRGNDLIVRLLQAQPAYAQSGVVLQNMPGFFQRIVQGGVQGTPPSVVQPPYETFPTEWVILGAQRLQVEIESEGKPR